jgi:hypothetical protein
MRLINDVADVLARFFIVNIAFRVDPGVCIRWNTSVFLEFVQSVTQFPFGKPRLLFEVAIGGSWRLSLDPPL